MKGFNETTLKMGLLMVHRLFHTLIAYKSLRFHRIHLLTRGICKCGIMYTYVSWRGLVVAVHQPPHLCVPLNHLPGQLDHPRPDHRYEPRPGHRRRHPRRRGRFRGEEVPGRSRPFSGGSWAVNRLAWMGVGLGGPSSQHRTAAGASPRESFVPSAKEMVSNVC